MLTNFDTALALDERAVRSSVELVRRITPDDLRRVTPCAGWDLGRLVAHMSAQHRGFAASADGRGDDPAAWHERPPVGSPGPDHAEAAEEALAAFAADGVRHREFALPDFGPGVRLPAGRALTAHFVDAVVHSWDVARSLGLRWQPDEEVLRAALWTAERVPDGAERLRPGAAFRPGLPVPEQADALERTLLLLGRSPRWPEPAGEDRGAARTGDGGTARTGDGGAARTGDG